MYLTLIKYTLYTNLKLCIRSVGISYFSEVFIIFVTNIFVGIYNTGQNMFNNKKNTYSVKIEKQHSSKFVEMIHMNSHRYAFVLWIF